MTEHLLRARHLSRPWGQYSFVRAAATEYHRWGSLNNRALFSHSSGGKKAETKILIGPIPSEATLLALWEAIFPFCPHVGFPLRGHMSVSKFLMLGRTPVILD